MKRYRTISVVAAIALLLCAISFWAGRKSVTPDEMLPPSAHSDWAESIPIIRWLKKQTGLRFIKVTQWCEREVMGEKTTDHPMTRITLWFKCFENDEHIGTGEQFAEIWFDDDGYIARFKCGKAR